MLEKKNKTFYEKVGKRSLDFLISLFILILFSPILIIVAILVRVKLGSPVLFTQERPGLGEKIFKMYKFRSMSDKKDAEGNLLPDKERLTTFGRRLRSTSLDELPELFNILKGDMSIVGPRPLLKEYLPYYKPEERLRHSVRPGITGLAQVSGRNAINWEEKFNYDIKYCKNVTLLNDLRIIYKTVEVVLLRKNILVGDQHIVGRLDDERK